MQGFDQIAEKLQKLDEKQRNWVLGGVLLLIFLGDYFLIMQPFQISNLMKISPKITVLEKDLQQSRTDIKRFEEYKASVKELRGKMKKVGNKILSIEEIPAILENLSRIAQKNNVRINQIMPMRDSMKEVLKNDEGRYYSLPVLINARGGYHDLGRFFNMIETNDVFMSITGLNIAAMGEDERYQAARLTIKAFVLERVEDDE